MGVGEVNSVLSRYSYIHIWILKFWCLRTAVFIFLNSEVRLSLIQFFSQMNVVKKKKILRIWSKSWTVSVFIHIEWCISGTELWALRGELCKFTSSCQKSYHSKMSCLPCEKVTLFMECTEQDTLVETAPLQTVPSECKPCLIPTLQTLSHSYFKLRS